MDCRFLERLVRGDFRHKAPGPKLVAKWAPILGVTEQALALAFKESWRRRMNWEHRIPGIDPGPLP